MILIGDFLNYLGKYGLEVEESLKEDSATFSFPIHYPEFSILGILTYDYEDGLITFMTGILKPKYMDNIFTAMNALNKNCSFLKCYYSHEESALLIEAMHVVTEENFEDILDEILEDVLVGANEYIENLWYTANYPEYDSLEEDEFDIDDDTTVEEDLEELMGLLKKEYEN